jgi:ATPase subunit of ABC transporter with duplicated ATPase domains
MPPRFSPGWASRGRPHPAECGDPGGYKLRVLLAQALPGKPQALLLDEPTNNLDLDSIRWLEGFLREYEGILIAISHDRHFLNAICTHIADIDYQTIITYPGDYDDMVMAKAGVRSRIESENAEKQKKIAQLQDFVARFSAGTRASQVQSRKKAMEKLQLLRPEAQQHRASLHQARAEASQRQADAHRGAPHQALARGEVADDFSAGHPRREDRHHRPERRGQDHALQDPDGPARAGRGHAHLGT